MTEPSKCQGTKDGEHSWDSVSSSLRHCKHCELKQQLDWKQQLEWVKWGGKMNGKNT